MTVILLTQKLRQLHRPTLVFDAPMFHAEAGWTHPIRPAGIHRGRNKKLDNVTDDQGTKS